MFEWLKKIWSGVTGVKNSRSEPRRRLNLRRWLAGDTPGLWASDHFEESNRCTGYSYVAVKALALQFAQADVHCKNPAILRLLKRPNPNQSGQIFRFQCGQQGAITGTQYIWIVRNAFNVPVEMYVLPTGLTRAQAPSEEFPYGSYLVNPLNNFNAVAMPDGWIPNGTAQTLLVQGAELDARDVRAVRWTHPLYLNEGWSPFSAGALTLDIAEQVGRARFHALRNYSSPGLIVKIAEGIRPDEQEQLEAEIHDRNASPSNAKRNLLLPPGVEAEMHDAVTELEYLQSHGQARDDVLALHRTPPVAVGVTEAGTFAAFYAAMMQWTEQTVQPELDLLAGELTHALGDEIQLTARRIDDPDIKAKEVDQHIRASAITINEYRELYGMKPVSWGDGPIGVRRTDSLDKPGGGLPGDVEETGGDMESDTTGIGDPVRQAMPKQ